VNGLDATLAALADPTRRQVIDLLRRGPRRAGELATAIDTSGPAMSRHLRVLRTSGLVEADSVEHDARLRLYHLRPEPFAALEAWVGQIQQLWGAQLAAFKAHAERRRKAKP